MVIENVLPKSHSWGIEVRHPWTKEGTPCYLEKDTEGFRVRVSYYVL